MKKVYFIGGIFTDEIKSDLKKNSSGNIQYAADSFQKKIINGLNENLENMDINFEILNLPFLGSYPIRYKQMLIKNNETKYSNITHYLIGFNNLTLIKHISRYIRLKYKLFQLLKEDKKNNIDVTILVYSLHSPFLLALPSNVKNTVIVPDLPEYMNLGKKRNLLYSFLKKIDSYFLRKGLSKIDSYVLLTKYMIEQLPSKSYVVVEGIAEEEFELNPKPIKSRKKTIVYTGTLDEKYGILNFIKNYVQLKQTPYVIEIYGYGDSIKKIKEYSKNYPHIIKYCGLLEPDKIKKIQREATFLVNPRPSDEDYTKYSFPSKTMEYLSSGTPIIMTHLKGVPSQYYNYINVLDDSNSDNYLNSLENILNYNYDQLEQKAIEGRKFIMNKKNSVYQAEKILDFVLR